jgi:hypothetical protein
MNPRTLDALIAEHVFKGSSKVEAHFVKSVNVETGEIVTETRMEWPNYSTQIEAAWLVVDKMIENGFGFNIATMSEVDYSKNTGWDAWFVKLENKEHFGSWVDGTSSSPKAICLASLKALGVFDKNES